MRKIIKVIKKELKVIINLEHEELSEFNKLVKETLEEMEKTRKEMRLEDRIRLNLGFVHYKLSKIHYHVTELLELSKGMNERKMQFDINHRIKSILREIHELDREFLPHIKKNISIIAIGESKTIAEEMNREFIGYTLIVDRLKHILNLTSYSVDEIGDMSDIAITNMKTNIHRAGKKAKKVLAKIR